MPDRPCRSPIPALMATVEGTVEKVHMVKRVTSEGSELFSAEIVVPNAGVLAKDMEASATVAVNGETVYPYEAGKLDYYRTSELSIPVRHGRFHQSDRLSLRFRRPAAGAGQRREHREHHL